MSPPNPQPTKTEPRWAIVTGGASGIGRAVASRFASSGASVAIFDADADLGTRAGEEMGSDGAQVGFHHVDVSDPDSVTEAVSTVGAEWGGVDAVVNAAAIPASGEVLESYGSFARTLEVNLIGPYLVSKEAIRWMRRGDGGSIVNIASVHGLASLPECAAYAASKGGLIALTRAMALDHAPEVRVNCIAPGSVRTPMLESGAHDISPEDPESVIEAWGRSHPMGRVAGADEIAEAAFFLASPDASMITGTCLVVDGGLTARLAL